VANWYLDQETDKVAYQALKYRQREGWTHRDLLRLSHPYGDATRNALFSYICGREATPELRAAVPLVEGFIKAQETGADIPALVGEFGLSWEMIPDEALTKAGTWEALLDKGMPMTALMRQLPRLTNLGVLTARGERTKAVTAQLTDAARLRKGRVHPINVLVAHKTYEGGRSLRGQSTWQPVRQVVDALDAGFYAAYGAVEPTGKRTLLALDVSGSMMSPAAGLPLSCREVTAAMALVTANVEKDYSIVGFTSGGGRGWSRESVLSELAISPRQRLSDVVRVMEGLPFGGTDCSLPFTVAQEKGWKLDGIVVYTDNETYAGSVHPHIALQKYRKATGINTRSVVVGMTATNFSIADPKDPGMLDCVGMDTSVPTLISDFIRS
jgi:60 kDa SS-A/Ro ribonucleoprotein